jgi:uncharacterized membrane protein YdjX (TVP38/TMEM64 family)
MFNKIGRFLKKYVFHIITVLLLALILVVWRLVPEQKVIDFISKAGVWGPIIYIVIMVIGQIFAPISTVSLNIAGYYLFGEEVIIYLFVIGLLSSVINYSIAKQYGWFVLKKLIGEKGANEVKEILNGLGKKSLIFVRLFSFTINDFASYAFGFTNMKFRDFLLYSTLGQLIWVVLWEFVFKRFVGNILSFTLVFLLSSLPFIIFIEAYLNIKRSKKEVHLDNADGK